MAVLGTSDRKAVAAGLMREPGSDPCAFTKVQLTNAIAAADDWVEANTASFNTVLPAAFRTAATTAQKIRLLCMVLERRAGRLRVSEDT